LKSIDRKEEIQKVLDEMTAEEIDLLVIFLHKNNVLDLNDYFDTISDNEYNELLRRAEEMANGDFVTLKEIRAKRMTDTHGKEDKHNNQ